MASWARCGHILCMMVLISLLSLTTQFAFDEIRLSEARSDVASMHRLRGLYDHMNSSQPHKSRRMLEAVEQENSDQENPMSLFKDLKQSESATDYVTQHEQKITSFLEKNEKQKIQDKLLTAAELSRSYNNKFLIILDSKNETVKRANQEYSMDPQYSTKIDKTCIFNKSCILAAGEKTVVKLFGSFVQQKLAGYTGSGLATVMLTLNLTSVPLFSLDASVDEDWRWSFLETFKNNGMVTVLETTCQNDQLYEVYNMRANYLENYQIPKSPADHTMRYDWQSILIMEDDPVVREAATFLYEKHPTVTSVYILENEKPKLIKGDAVALSQDSRLVLVGHGTRKGETRLGGYKAEKVAEIITKIDRDGDQIKTISLVACETGSDEVFMHTLMKELQHRSIETTLHLRTSLLQVSHTGRKTTVEITPNGLVNKYKDSTKKVVVQVDNNGEINIHKLADYSGEEVFIDEKNYLSGDDVHVSEFVQPEARRLHTGVLEDFSRVIFSEQIGTKLRQLHLSENHKYILYFLKFKWVGNRDKRIESTLMTDKNMIKALSKCHEVKSAADIQNIVAHYGNMEEAEGKGFSYLMLHDWIYLVRHNRLYIYPVGKRLSKHEIKDIKIKHEIKDIILEHSNQETYRCMRDVIRNLGREEYVNYARQTFQGTYVKGDLNPRKELWFTTYFVASVISESSRNFRTFPVTLMYLELSRHSDQRIRDIATRGLLENHSMARGGSWINPRKRGFRGSSNAVDLRYRKYADQLQNLKGITYREELPCSYFYSEANSVEKQISKSQGLYTMFGLEPIPDFAQTFQDALQKRRQKLPYLGGMHDGDVSHEDVHLATEQEFSMKLFSYYSHLSHKLTKHVETQLSKDYGEEWRGFHVKPNSLQIKNGDLHCLLSKSQSEDIPWKVAIPKEDRQLMEKLFENLSGVSEMKIPEPSEIHKTPENLEKMGKVVGTLGLMLGMQGAVHAFERGDISAGIIGTLQTTQGITDMSLAAIAKASVTSKLKVIKSAKIFMESRAGKKILQVMPITGYGFGIYNVKEDFIRKDTLGYIDGSMDSSLLVIDLVEIFQPELVSILAPVSLGINMIRMLTDDVYINVKDKLENLPPDAGTLGKIGAVIKGVGGGIVDFVLDIASFFYTIPYREIEEGHRLVQRISDFHKYYTFHEVQAGRQAIDFISGDVSWNAGSITFHLHEEHAELCMDRFVSSNESLQKNCFSIKTNQTKDIVLGIGESHEFVHSKVPRKVLLFIPAGHTTVVSGYKPLTDTRYGTYYGDDQDNHFFAVQTNKDSHDMEVMLSYYYKLYGNSGADIFYLGPQKSTVEGQSGMDTYIIPETGGNTVINNYDADKARDSLIFSVNYTDISATKLGDDVILHYATDHKVRILNWFVGEQYQHINLISADGVFFEISPSMRPSVQLIAKGVNMMSRKQGQSVNTSESLLLGVTNIMGSPHDDDLIGNKQNNVIDGGGGVDYVTGGEGEDIYVVKERSHSIVNIDNYSHDRDIDMVIIEAELSSFRVSVHGDDLSLIGYFNIIVTLKNWFHSEAYRHLLIITKDLITFTVSENKNLCKQSDPFKSKCILSQSIDYRNSNNPLQVDLVSHDAFRNVTHVYGSNFNDSIIGNANHNTIVSGQGNDFLQGMEGEDLYVLTPGQGLKIIDNNSTDLVVDTLFLKEKYDHIHCKCNGDNMIIAINGTDEVLLKNWFMSPASQHLQTQSSDGITFHLIHNNNQCNNLFKTPWSVDYRNKRSGQTMLMNQGEFNSVVDIYGSSGFDVMVGNEKDNTLDPHTGGGKMIGGNGSDTYIVKPEAGVKLEIDNFATDGKVDIVMFNADFLHGQISVKFEESDALVVTMVKGYEAQVRLLNYSSGPFNQHLSFLSLDGVFFRVRSPGKNHPIYQQTPWIEAYKVKLLNKHADCHIDLSSQKNLSSVHTVHGCPGQHNFIIGNKQDNALFGGIKKDTIEGGPGHDSLIGGGGDDVLMGSSGNDTMYGEEGDDLMMGGSGPDVFIPGPGADVMDGGPGRDTVLYQGDHKRDEGVYVNLLTGIGLQADAAGDVLKDIENVIGTIYSDILISGYEPTLLKGSDGDDILVSVVGDDYLIGGEGRDIYLLISQHGLLTINNCAEDTAMDVLYLRFLSMDTVSCSQATDWLSLSFKSNTSVLEVRLMKWQNTANECGHLTLILKEGKTSVEELQKICHKNIIHTYL